MSNVSDSALERNLERLVREGADPLTEERLKRLLSGIRQRRAAPAPRSARWLSAAAAGLVVALCVWFAVATRESGPKPAVQAEAPRKKEIDEWLSKLGHAEVADRERAQKQVAGLAEDLVYALASLDRLQKSDDSEVRTRAGFLRAALLERMKEAAAIPGALRLGIEKVREAWLKRDYSNIEEMIRQAFKPWELTYVRYVPKLEVGDHLESNNGEDFMKFKPLTRLGGNRDLLTEEVYRGLCEGDGIVGFDADWAHVVPRKTDDLASLGRTLIFTLPDGTKKADGKPHWDKYVVIGYPTAR